MAFVSNNDVKIFKLKCFKVKYQIFLSIKIIDVGV